MIPDPLCILVTGAGAPGVRGTIYALRKNPDDVLVKLVGTDTRGNPVGRHMVDAFAQVPSPSAADYLDAMTAICQREHVRVILPQTTREIEVLSQQIERFAKIGVGIMVSCGEAIATANNKWKLMQAFERLGLPAPTYHLATSIDELESSARELGYPGKPVAVKPPLSNGMRGYRTLTEQPWTVERFLNEKPSGSEMTLADLLKILRSSASFPQLLVMEYLPGDEYSVDAFVGSKCETAIPRLRATIRSGISFDTTLEYREDLITPTLKAARDIGLRYAFGFQYKLDAAGVPKVLECNPRVQGTMAASVFSGANVIWMGIREVLGEPVAQVPPLHPASFHRYWGGIGVTAEGTDEI